MGYDQHHQSSSSGAAVAIVVAVLIVAVLGILVVVGAGLFFVQTSRVEAVTRERTVAELHRLGAEAHRADAEAQREAEKARAEATPASTLNFEVKLDREGNASVDGESIDLDELRARLVNLKEETGNACSVHIDADSECPVKHVVSVVDVCKEVGVADLEIASSEGSDISSVEAEAAQ